MTINFNANNTYHDPEIYGAFKNNIVGENVKAGTILKLDADGGLSKATTATEGSYIAACDQYEGCDIAVFKGCSGGYVLSNIAINVGDYIVADANGYAAIGAFGDQGVVGRAETSFTTPTDVTLLPCKVSIKVMC